MASFMLPAGGILKPIHFRAVEEIWCCIERNGKLWRKYQDREEVTHNHGEKVRRNEQIS